MIAGLWLGRSLPVSGQSLPADSVYNDIEGSLYAESISSLVRWRIFDGSDCADGEFCPDKPVDRRTAAVWIVRLLDEDDLPTTPSRFVDVDPESFGAHEIERLAELKITTGCRQEPLHFCPDGQVKRSHAAAFIARAYGLQPATTSPEFVDIDPGSWTADLIAALAGHELDFGCGQPGPSYCPDDRLTRGQMADFMYQVSRRIRKIKPEVPRHVHAARDESGRLWIRWRPSRYSDSSNLKAYRVQWWAADKEFGSAQSTDVADINRLWHLVGDVRDDATYNVRVVAVGFAANSSSSHVATELDLRPSMLDRLNSGSSHTELDSGRLLVADHFWRYLEHDFLPRYETDNPWLRSAWDYVKNETPHFEVCLRWEACRDDPTWASVHINCRSPSRTPRLSQCRAWRLFFRQQHITKDWLIAHELGHVLTLANGASDRGESLGLAFLYFVDLAGDNCLAGELYADALQTLVVGSDNTNYWRKCSSTPSRPTTEALDVVRQALAGEAPDWFEAHYAVGDGDRDYESVWADINRLPDRHRRATINNLASAFGGYCNKMKLAKLIDQDLELPRQPWVDGGCGPWANQE